MDNNSQKIDLLKSVEHPWERLETERNVPYYVNHSTEKTGWDHPKLTTFFETLSDMNHIRFSAYRTGMKLHALQKFLRLDMLTLSDYLQVFEHGGRFDIYENLGIANVDDIHISDIVKVLKSLYEYISTQNPITAIHLSLCTDLTLNWLQNIFDINRVGKMKLLSLKVAIVLLSSGELEQKYRHLFQLACHHDQCSKKSLGLLLQACIQIPRQLGEASAFGGCNIEPSVTSCFELAQSATSKRISVSDFLNWLKLEPQSLVWIPVLHRLIASENVKHQAKCNVCNQFPIVGIRYRCLRCFNFDTCQSCFFTGRLAKSHKLSHPMQEYCRNTSLLREDFKDFTRVIQNKFRGSKYFHKNKTLGYLPLQKENIEGEATPTGEEEPLGDEFVVTPTNVCPLHATEVLSHDIMSHSMNEDETHEKLERYAQRLEMMERNTSIDEETDEIQDEHTLISRYCSALSGDDESSDGPGRSPMVRSPVQILLAIDGQQKCELESMIRRLEGENTVLHSELGRLQQMDQWRRENVTRHPIIYNEDDRIGDGYLSDGHRPAYSRRDEQLLNEARLLRQHKERLEARMHVLEHHNEQLEIQLNRLRYLVWDSRSEPDVAAWHMNVSFPRHPRMADRTERRPPVYNAYDNRRAMEVVASEDEMDVVSSGGYSSSTVSHVRDEKVESLLMMADNVGKAMGSLVKILSDDEESEGGGGPPPINGRFISNHSVV